MRFLTLTCFLGTVFAAVITMSGVCSARNTPKHDCVSFAEASKHVGTTQGVSGTVLHVAEGTNGVTFLTFCQDHKTCRFTVVVFPDDLKKVGDIQQLEGRMVEIKGTIQDHDGRAEIVLRHPQQLGESAFAVVPSVPTAYDVERRAHYSAGKHTHPTANNPQPSPGAPIPIQHPGH